MPTPVYVSPFTGTVVTPTDVSYYPLAFATNQELVWPSIVNDTQVPAARIIDCVASAGGLSIALPPANQGTLGSDILFRNLGSFAFTITDATGGASFNVPVGISKYVYLSDNTTEAGIWQNVTFAAGTSIADAATLAGLGLTTQNGQLATTQNIVSISTTPTITNNSRAATFVWSAGAGTINLPSYAILSTGWYIGLRNNGTGQLIINPLAPSTINDQVSIIVNPGESGFILFDVVNNNFYTIGLTPPNSVTFTAATYDVDSIPGTTFNLTSFAPIIQTYIAQSGTRTATLDVTLPAITQIYVLANTTNESGYNITFQNQGSAQPPLVLSTGTIATVLSDGENLYPLTLGSTGTYFASNGTAVDPSFSFNNDTTTGMYLVGTGILGLTANGTNIINMDGSDALNPTVDVNARLIANLIDGGTFS
jgi:hypothetical protein